MRQGRYGQSRWGRAGGGPAGWAGSWAVFSLALRPGGCCDYLVPPRDHLSPSNWEAGSVCRGGGSVLVPEPLRTGIPGSGGWTGIPDVRGWTGIPGVRGPGVGALPAWVYELLVAMARVPTILSALWGYEQELKVHLTLFQLLFLQKNQICWGLC